MKFLLLLLIAACTLPSGLSAQQTQDLFSNSWFTEMYNRNTTSAQKDWDEHIKSTTFDQLREKYGKDHKALLELSWEERDQIWENVYKKSDFNSIVTNYHKAYLISCEERGVAPASFNIQNPRAADFVKLRNAYLLSRNQEYQILTPKPPEKPQINNALVYGARPGHEFIYKLAFTGARPAKIRVKGLPKGLFLNKDQGVIYGKVAQAGVYNIAIEVRNAHGVDKRQVVFKIGDQMALTPPLGWNSWNSFACDVTEENIRSTADQLIKTGLADYGYSYINIDDCWMIRPDSANHYKGFRDDLVADYHTFNNKGRIVRKKVRYNENEIMGKPRDASGTILSNKDFTMNSLTDYVHNKGFKIGLYSSPGPYTCQTYEGSYQHEMQDAKQYASWGFDYLKYDWCSYRLIADKQPSREELMKPFTIMGDALKQLDRDIFYSLCQYGMGNVWEWGAKVGGNAWRTSHDIRDNWKSLMDIVEKQHGLENYASPGHWNDPDMLVVGYVGWNRNLRPTNLSPNEQYTHISLWSLLASPLLIGCDLTRLDDFTKSLIANPEVIRINQDTLGIQGSKRYSEGDFHVYTKQLSGGEIAVGVFNFGEKSNTITLSPNDILPGTQQLVDAWRIEDLPYNGKSLNLKVNRHGARLLILKPKSKS